MGLIFSNNNSLRVLLGVLKHELRLKVTRMISIFLGMTRRSRRITFLQTPYLEWGMVMTPTKCYSRMWAGSLTLKLSELVVLGRVTITLTLIFSPKSLCHCLEGLWILALS
jgi:hypothetical protein